ncbi:prepilin-type N-terminal cleavage/methylation domain-containing protein [Peptoclostridium litorale DSM 5388]|uniref:Uncharacterized protein n=1 Tax=Peptoclostridium litorale DSM 5388 TaxID=1121324 RepID=A0A069RHR5_PEPLI|nr:prepilin-type N-terminal cleavage/methylation domain-containing protein [Peptoclostridium litorale]KDR93812.1 hypothetical protein CLIT_23c00840 [Peptoclostridium litorale DSM 5388]SIN86313.1 prepilin-type N-terminal cleavage/methylation domain-containing protein [Peptoclostridium litorale DSM 5388]
MKSMFIGIKKMLKGNRGFTLIELIVVIAVLGMIASIAVPKVGGITQKAKTNADKQTIAILNNAVEMYVAESGDSDLSEFTDEDDAAKTIKDLQDEITGPHGNKYGPYLRDDVTTTLPSGKTVTCTDGRFK